MRVLIITSFALPSTHRHQFHVSQHSPTWYGSFVLFATFVGCSFLNQTISDNFLRNFVVFHCFTFNSILFLWRHFPQKNSPRSSCSNFCWCCCYLLGSLVGRCSVFFSILCFSCSVVEMLCNFGITRIINNAKVGTKLWLLIYLMRVFNIYVICYDERTHSYNFYLEKCSWNGNLH